jgi:hypothetical protein
MRRSIWGVLIFALAACATTPLAPGPDRWESELRTYQDRLQEFNADARKLLEDFQVLRANPSFAAVERKVKELAARIAGGDTANPNELIVAGLHSMALEELLVFTRFLALSTRWLTLEATRSELESLRLDLWARKVAGEGSLRGAVIQTAGMPVGNPSIVEQPIRIPWSCTSCVVGNLSFANCYEAGVQ